MLHQNSFVTVIGVFALLALALGGAVGIVLWTADPFGWDSAPAEAVLVFEVDLPEDSMSTEADVDMEALLAAMSRRISRFEHDVTVRPNGQIEVGVFDDSAETLNCIQRILEMPGTLEVRFLADRELDPSFAQRIATDKGRVLRDDSGQPEATWVSISHSARSRMNRAQYGYEDSNTLYERSEAFHEGNADGPKDNQVLVLDDDFDVTGDYVSQVEPAYSAGVISELAVHFDETGRSLLEQLTSGSTTVAVNPYSFNQTVRRLGIIVNGRLLTVDELRGPVSRKVVISGGFKPGMLQDLVHVLNAGTLPVAIRHIETRRNNGPVDSVATDR